MNIPCFCYVVIPAVVDDYFLFVVRKTFARVQLWTMEMVSFKATITFMTMQLQFLYHMDIEKALKTATSEK